MDAAVNRIEDRIKERVHDVVENVLTPGQTDPGRPSESPSSTSDPDRWADQPLAPLIAGIEPSPLEQVGSPQKHQSEMEALLRGIPSGAAAAAFRDWKSDLLGANDPDPETDLTTPLDYRLVRQLEAGPGSASFDSLPRPVRERLENAAWE